MSLNNYFSLNAAGDTIVEVMVVLAVLGMAISISYATANRSLLDTRQAQENSTATELVQAKIEQLRTLVSAGSTPNIFQTGPYCIDSSNALQTSLSPTYPPACEDSSHLYKFFTTYTPTAGSPTSAGGTFKIVAQWPDVEGQGNDTVTMSYRLYQP